MYKHNIIAVVLAIVLALVWTAPAMAKGVEITGVIESVVVKLDKNNNEYVRFIVPVAMKSESGVEYTQSLPFMAFGDQVEQAKLFKAGDTLNVIASHRTFGSRESYTILKYLE